MNDTLAGASPVDRTVRPCSEARPLVERLREGTYYGQHALMNDAADEIDLLRAEVAVLRMACGRWEDALKRSDKARREAVDAEREQCALKAAIHSQYPVTTEYDKGYAKARADAAAAIRGA